MNPAVAIALGALFAALAPLWAMWFTYRQSSATSYEARLERENTDLRNQLTATKAHVTELQEENLRLMRKLTEG